jgi:hypothetical protein
MRLYILLAVLVSLLSGCASNLYSETDRSVFTGALDVRWIKNDYFIFIPNTTNPFKLVRADGTEIVPGVMYTDGGSIPRFLWGVNGFSPWGYAPAYIVHDWLFVAHRCGYQQDSQYSFDDSILVMAEGLKAVMQDNPEVRNYFVFDSVVAAISSPIAKRLWDNGSCTPPPTDLQELNL